MSAAGFAYDVGFYLVAALAVTWLLRQLRNRFPNVNPRRAAALQWDQGPVPLISAGRRDTWTVNLGGRVVYRGDLEGASEWILLYAAAYEDLHGKGI